MQLFPPVLENSLQRETRLQEKERERNGNNSDQQGREDEGAEDGGNWKCFVKVGFAETQLVIT
jgi:hypothetical protein